MTADRDGRPDGFSTRDPEDLLRLVCRELGMETGFIARVADDARTICHVSGPGLERGHADPYDQTYCQLIVDGTIGPAVPDTSAEPLLRDMPVTAQLGIASYLGLPLRLSDGSLYGTLCTYSRQVKPDLVDSDVRLLRLVASLVVRALEDDVQAERRHADRRATITALLSAGQPAVVFQPIVDLGSGEPVGYEALARFTVEPYRTPDVWIAEAATVGLGVELELQAISNALQLAEALPAGRYLSVNASPSVVTTGRLPDVLGRSDRPIVVEITEHEQHDGALNAALDELRVAGHQIAVDDSGAGYAGLTRIVEIRPDIVKLDRSLIAGVDTDTVRQAMVGAAVAFTAKAGGIIVAEGIEREAEAIALRTLGVRSGQGYHFGRPASVEQLTGVPSGRPLAACRLSA